MKEILHSYFTIQYNKIELFKGVFLMKKISIFSFSLLIFSIITISFQNCAKNSFKVNNVLLSSSVFGAATDVLSKELPESRLNDIQSNYEQNGAIDPLNPIDSIGGIDNRKKVCFLDSAQKTFLKSGESREIPLDSTKWIPELCGTGVVERKLFGYSQNQICNDGTLEKGKTNQHLLLTEKCPVKRNEDPIQLSMKFEKYCVQAGGYGSNGSVSSTLAESDAVKMILLKNHPLQYLIGKSDVTSLLIAETILTTNVNYKSILSNSSINEISFTFNNLPDGKYSLYLYNPNFDNIPEGHILNPLQKKEVGSDKDLLFSYNNLFDSNYMGYYFVRKLSDKPINIIVENGSVINADYKNGDNSSVFNREVFVDRADKNRELCNSIGVHSPLIIDMRKEIKKDTTGIELTSQLNGILFDLLGLNSNPSPHSKKQISWISEPLKYMFLTLPNQEGKVLGINELFGNNTYGKDGKFAENGYLALAKFDENRDNIINKNDEVFSKLRLWTDLNKNGVSEATELFELSDSGVESISLNYNKNYIETDMYGNKTTMRSLVNFNNGAQRLIFDLWFKINQ